MKDFVLEQKQAVIAEIREKIENSGSLVLVDYRGLTVEQVTDLRNRYRAAGVQYKVYKNTMMKFAFKELGFEDFGKYLERPSAVAFSGRFDCSGKELLMNLQRQMKNLLLKQVW